ncbi:hypothetical protein SAMN05444743_12280 [Pseudomonas sp. PDC86]|uniref:Uncharacterized protein n=1 Tax=Pseudomonas gorinensis TaxID=3240790 RepID=A0ACA7PDH6_9PSED|nr:hypothetical protein U771_27275 [Pseudomonas sp. TKP]SDZ60678.1 hypothetical protein SAMN05444743_12280 [Pseudomonas sp. PDC86]
MIQKPSHMFFSRGPGSHATPALRNCLAQLLHQYPAFSKVATLCGSAYLLYIAYSIIKSVLAKKTATHSV